MISDIFLYILSFILGVIGNMLTFVTLGWHIWPASVIDGLTYFCQHLMSFNIIFPIDTLLTALKFFVGFEAIYLPARLLIKFFNWIRGAGPMEI